VHLCRLRRFAHSLSVGDKAAAAPASVPPHVGAINPAVSGGRQAANAAMGLICGPVMYQLSSTCEGSHQDPARHGCQRDGSSRV
jgi:hypothetical protein